MAKKRTDREEEKPARGPASAGKPAGRKTSSQSTRAPATSRPAAPRAARSGARERIISSAERPRIHATHGKTATEGRERSTSSARPNEGRLRALPVRNPAASAKRPLPGARRTPGRPEATPTTNVSGTTRTPSAQKRRSVPPTAQGPSAASKELALAIASAGLDKKALGVEVLDVTGKVDYADFLVIMTGSSDRHVHAIAMGIDEALRRRKIQPLSVEGLTAATWVLLDFDDVVVHVFQEDTRRIYDIEGLWMDASRVEVSNVDGHRSASGTLNGR